MVMSESSGLQEIRELLQVISQKLDLLLEERETAALMKLSEESLKGFLEGEPDLYTDEDLKVRYS
jgi:hypothetical protein